MTMDIADLRDPQLKSFSRQGAGVFQDRSRKRRARG
jgi:hypothetical protein